MDRLYVNSCRKKASGPVFSSVMLRPLLPLFALLAFASSASAQAILIEESRPVQRGTAPVTESEEETSFYSRSKTTNVNKPAVSASVGASSGPAVAPAPARERGNLKSYFDRKDYVDLYQLRSARRMGVGVEVLGRLGMVGVDFDFNFDPAHSATAGIGAGPQYFSYSLGYKHVLTGNNLSPYVGVALNRMTAGSGTPMTESTPGWINDYFLTDADRTDKGFQKNFISPQLGLQFTQFYGPSAGGSFFFEVLLMYEIETRRTAPVGALGMMYYL